MAQNEAARQTGEPIVVSDSPDVCLTNGAPVPYSIVAYFPSSIRLATTVLFTEDPAFTVVSSISGVIGDEAGNGMGVVSGSHAGGGYTHVVSGSHTPNVLAEEHLVVFHLSKMEMNCGSPLGPGNTIGTVLWQSVVRDAWLDENGNLLPLSDALRAPETEAELDQALAEENPGPEPEWSLEASRSRRVRPQPWERRSRHAEPGKRVSDTTKVEVQRTTTHFDESLGQLGGDDAYVRVGHAEATTTAGASRDSKGTYEATYGANASFQTIAAHGQLGGDRANVQVNAEALSAEANAEVSASAGPDGVAVKGGVSLEAMLGKIDGSVQVRITAQDVVDARLNSWLEYLDIRLTLPKPIGETGVVITGGGELSAGAKVEAEGEARLDKTGFRLSGKLAAALGLGAGLNGSIGLELGDGLVDGAVAWFSRTFGG